MTSDDLRKQKFFTFISDHNSDPGEWDVCVQYGRGKLGIPGVTGFIIVVSEPVKAG